MAATKQRRMNVRLLRKIAGHILEEPKRLNMDTWGTTPETNHIGIGIQSWPSCGTVCCIGGWADILSSKTRPRWLRETGYGSEARFCKLLGLTEDQGSRLFHEHRWPAPFESAIALIRVQTKGYARITAARIEFFIKTKGTDIESGRKEGVSHGKSV